jgi:hypothetical protein
MAGEQEQLKVYRSRRPVLGLKPSKDYVGPIGYGMKYDSESERIPTVPGQVHSSLFQRVLVHRWQISVYISKLRNYGMRPDHPAVHVQTIINSGPANPGGHPVQVSRFGRPAYKGTMRPLSRFRKALPVSQVPYTPPEY